MEMGSYFPWLMKTKDTRKSKMCIVLVLMKSTDSYVFFHMSA